MDRPSYRVVAAALALTLTAGVVYSGPAQGSAAVAPMPIRAVGVDRGSSPHLHGATSGRILARARELDPLTGAFLQRDPNGYQDSVNQYAYGANDPVNRRDPTGRSVHPCVALSAQLGITFDECVEQMNANPTDRQLLTGTSGVADPLVLGCGTFGTYDEQRPFCGTMSLSTYNRGVSSQQAFTQLDILDSARSLVGAVAVTDAQVFTQDPNKIAAAGKLGTAIDNVAFAVAITGAMRGQASDLRPNILVDTDIISHAMAGDASAIAFLREKSGRTEATGRTVGELMKKNGRSRADITSFMRENGISFTRSNGAAGRAVAEALGRSGITHRSDNILLGTALAGGKSFATFGDGKAMSGAIRLGIDARIVVPNARATRRIQAALAAGGRPEDYFWLTGPDQ